MTKNKMVQSGTRSHQEKKKELAGNEKEWLLKDRTDWQIFGN
jgi:hypothetical protein